MSEPTRGPAAAAAAASAEEEGEHAVPPFGLRRRAMLLLPPIIYGIPQCTASLRAPPARLPARPAAEPPYGLPGCHAAAFLSLPLQMNMHAT